MQPFYGLRILDLTHVFAGPFSTYQLSVMGAEVIKIEAVNAPDMMRQVGPDEQLNEQAMGLGFQAQASNKKALALDLKQSQGRDIFHKLVRTADVVVQNYTSGCLIELGLDAATLRAIKPDLIYCSISGYGRTGPKSHDPAYDNVIQAYTGIMCANGEAESDPVRVGPAVVDYGTGAQAAFAISAALYRRLASGEGCEIDVAMSDAALMLLNYHVVSTLATGQAPKPCGNKDPVLAGYSAYTTLAGQIMLGAYTPRQLANLMQVLGSPARALAVINLGLAELAGRRDDDEWFISQALMAKTAAEWEDLLNKAQVPAARIKPIEETLQTAQIQQRPVLQKAGSDDHARHTPVAGFSFDKDGPTLHSGAPQHGQHTQSLLLELGFSNQDIESLAAQNVVLTQA